jgi:hypothetical protein
VWVEINPSKASISIPTANPGDCQEPRAEKLVILWQMGGAGRRQSHSDCL